MPHFARTASTLERAGSPAFSSFTTVLDLDPARTLAESLPARAGLQCATCSIAAFLHGLPQVEAFDGLAQLSATFRELPRVVTAFRTQRAEDVRELTGSLGIARAYEVVPENMAPLSELAHVYLTDGLRMPTGLTEQDWLLVPLASALGKDGSTSLARVHTNVLVGYVEHARAIEEYGDAVQHSSRDSWSGMLGGLLARGVERAGFIAAVTPCASLRWPQNRPLESLRARLDLAFRRVDADASLMCPENVSGYALSSDLERVPAELLPRAATRAIRVDRLLLVVGP
jgi:hypothetical protein